MRECVKNCEHLEFENNNFKCSLYGEDIEFNHDINSITPLRCKKCMDDNVIGTNSDNERARKLRKYVGWMADSFYSHKEELEEFLTIMYKIIRDMEKENKDEEVRIFKDKKSE